MTHDQLEAWQNEQMAANGWFAHFVGPAEKSKLVNYHTHGVLESFGHPDFQIVYGISPPSAEGFFRDLIGRVKNGEKFEDGQVLSGLLKKLDILFVERKEQDRQVLRIVFPDPQGYVQRDTIHENYLCQFEENEP